MKIKKEEIMKSLWQDEEMQKIHAKRGKKRKKTHGERPENVLAQKLTTDKYGRHLDENKQNNIHIWHERGMMDR